jgi:hypothetical protein
MYFKLDLSFYMFALIFEQDGWSKLREKINIDKYFDTDGVLCNQRCSWTKMDRIMNLLQSW